MQKIKKFKKIHMDMPIEICIDNNTFSARRDIRKAFKVFSEYEKRFSRFNEKSELSKLNESQGKFIKVSRELLEIVKLSLEGYVMTEGKFDISVGAFLKLYGYDKEMKFKFPKKKLKSLLKKRKKLDEIEINEKESKIKLHKGQILEPAAIVKSMAIQEAYEILDKYENFLISGGGDVIAKGEWKIGIESPYNREKVWGSIQVHDKAVCTSGTYLKDAEFDDLSLNHLIDPINGMPCKENLSVTVVDSDIVKSNIFSTSLILMEKDEAHSIATKNNIEYFMIDKKYNAYGTKFFAENIL